MAAIIKQKLLTKLNFNYGLINLNPVRILASTNTFVIEGVKMTHCNIGLYNYLKNVCVN